MSGFGFGGAYDESLGSKIDQLLAGRPSSKQRVEEFLLDELHVDPSKLPMSYNDALKFINDKMGERDSHQCHLHGSTMGLSYVRFDKSADQEPNACPNCGYTGSFDSLGKNRWECYDCDQPFTWTPPKVTEERVTERSDKSLWPDLLRVYNALVKGYKPEADPIKLDEDELVAKVAVKAGIVIPNSATKPKKATPPPQTDFTKFDCTHSWNTATVVGVPDKKPRWKRADKYPTGTRLRVTNGTDTEWVRVGGPFSDTDLVNLATMKPISNAGGWTVLEVLNDDE